MCKNVLVSNPVTVNIYGPSRNQAEKLQNCHDWYRESFKAVVSACGNFTALKTSLR